MVLDLVRAGVDGLPDGLSCHEVCAHLAAALPRYVEHRRGHFHGLWSPSWLTLPGTRLLIDPYPWAAASGPLLVCLDGQSPWRHIYVEGDRAVERRPLLFRCV